MCAMTYQTIGQVTKPARRQDYECYIKRLYYNHIYDVCKTFSKLLIKICCILKFYLFPKLLEANHCQILQSKKTLKGQANGM